MAADQPVFLLLGGNVLNSGIVSKFKRAGWSVVVADWNESPALTGDRHYRVDVKDANAILDALHRDRMLDKVRFAYSSIDLAVESVSKINGRLGMRVLSREALGNVTSKSAMTARWREAGLLNRLSRSYDAYDPEIEASAREMDVIVKPDNSASSRGITILNLGSDATCVRAAFEKAREEATNRRVVVEEFVVGTEHTVEMLGDGEGHVAVYAISKKAHTDNTFNNKIAVKLHYNVLPAEKQQRIADFGMRCYRALGLTSSLGHLEVLEKKDGTFSPVEIGARSSGFIASDLVDAASGKDYLFDLIDVHYGGQVSPGLVAETGVSSMYYFYDLPSGKTIRKACGLMDFLDPTIISRFTERSRLVEGFHVPAIANDNERLGIEVLVGPKGVMTEERVLDAERRMLAAMF